MRPDIKFNENNVYRNMNILLKFIEINNLRKRQLICFAFVTKQHLNQLKKDRESRDTSY